MHPVARAGHGLRTLYQLHSLLVFATRHSMNALLVPMLGIIGVHHPQRKIRYTNLFVCVYNYKLEAMHTTRTVHMPVAIDKWE